jgi:reactive intermediate/imine deaminase
MANKAIIQTDQAPGAIGTYSQAIKINNTVYLSGQIPLDPEKMALVSENIDDQINQVFLNLRAVCEAAGGDLSNIVKLNIFLTDLDHFSIVNEIMSQYFTTPYPARAAIGVKSLPKGSKVEMDGVVVI